MTFPVAVPRSPAIVLLAASALAGSPSLAAPPGPAHAAASEASVAGHYYLSGVMETGSELLLREDGTFEWYISYGALDRFAKGRWSREGASVILKPDGPDDAKPLYAPLGAEPWDLQAEQALLRQQAEEAADAVAARCPFLAGWADIAVTPVPTIDEAATVPVSRESLRRKAAETLQTALLTRNRAAMLARRALDAPSPEANEAVGKAFAAWFDARAAAQSAAGEAYLPDPDLAEPELPAPCIAPETPDAADIPREQWTGGIAVRVLDPVREQTANHVRVTLRHADGQEEQIETGSGGLAIRPGTPDSPVVAVGLSAPYAPGRDASFRIEPASDTVLSFSIDGGQLEQAPFESMRLRIVGQDLAPDIFEGKGLYRRAR
ncbi:hypothetical protein [Novosphingobium sp. ST904]|uniref:hypothetical protein n=1 Tax=Novosphingobium sp. ST904 TaxID=1684385 RepID=UPI0006C833FC|nr:hypothetical protein [Novosphingobium sp. ST904]TCM30764.1 hypothetical protein EDF59_12662 [Novosphingobium sp. ST904]